MYIRSLLTLKDSQTQRGCCVRHRMCSHIECVLIRLTDAKRLLCPAPSIFTNLFICIAPASCRPCVRVCVWGGGLGFRCAEGEGGLPRTWTREKEREKERERVGLGGGREREGGRERPAFGAQLHLAIRAGQAWGWKAWGLWLDCRICHELAMASAREPDR
jgi:hypothetical protein